MTTNEYLMDPSIPVISHDPAILRHYARLTDGTTISIQAGAYLECQPSSNAGPWTHVELATAPDPRLIPYDAGSNISSQTHPDWRAYICVPVGLVDELVAEHGGIVGIANDFE